MSSAGPSPWYYCVLTQSRDLSRHPEKCKYFSNKPNLICPIYLPHLAELLISGRMRDLTARVLLLDIR